MHVTVEPDRLDHAGDRGLIEQLQCTADMVVVDVSDDEEIDDATGCPKRVEPLDYRIGRLCLAGIDQDVVLRGVPATVGHQDRITIACREKFYSQHQIVSSTSASPVALNASAIRSPFAMVSRRAASITAPKRWAPDRCR
jgi:hypothetical protein